ncbi:hypothetical protein [Streptomyces showdoensis]|uniref:Uncharacterized protein n=1 Tax=Streptomyces showdoensis TaxID=68268 RepID=A0A2P2GE48_STREW|nr:hypothetical protein [Streptomyces showdoensis]KKZ69781.1 hypothetical protein VO63_32530 [Streptomyces showdoensis]
MTVTRTARLTGAALCAALALVIVVWLLSDLATFRSPVELLWYWAGDRAFLLRRRAATSLVDPVLLVAYLATAFAALRSSLAGPALAVTGLTTLALRLPGLWAAGVDALVTTLLTLALAAGLVVTASAGRRDEHEQEREGEPGGPTRPRTGPAVAAGALCGLAALVWAAWEVHWATALPVEFTVDRFTGGRSLLLPALAVPPGWLDVVLTLLLLAAALSALTRARHARPVGLLAGLLLTGWGTGGVATALRAGWFGGLADLEADTLLAVLTSVFAVLAGAAVMVLLARPGARRRSPYRPVAALPPAPPARRPPGW